MSAGSKSLPQLYIPTSCRNQTSWSTPSLIVERWNLRLKNALLIGLYCTLVPVWRILVQSFKPAGWNYAIVTTSALELNHISEPPSVSPQISGLPAQLPLNKWVKLTCSLPWMNVKPKLEFFVNGKKAKHKVSRMLSIWALCEWIYRFFHKWIVCQWDPDL